jgi:hypothetical protein
MVPVPHSNWKFMTNADLLGDYIYPVSTDSYIEADMIQIAGFPAMGIYFIGAGTPWKFLNLFGHTAPETIRYNVPANVTAYAIRFFGFDTSGSGGATRFRVTNVLLHSFLWDNVFKEKKIEIITITASNICGTGLV